MSNHQVSLDSVRVHIPGVEIAESPRPPRNSSPSNTRRSGSEIEKYWSSPCGGRWSVQCIRFLSQYIVLTGMLVFFSVALYQADTCEETNLWQSLVLLVFGVMIPSPSVK